MRLVRDEPCGGWKVPAPSHRCQSQQSMSHLRQLQGWVRPPTEKFFFSCFLHFFSSLVSRTVLANAVAGSLVVHHMTEVHQPVQHHCGYHLVTEHRSPILEALVGRQDGRRPLEARRECLCSYSSSMARTSLGVFILTHSLRIDSEGILLVSPSSFNAVQTLAFAGEFRCRLTIYARYSDPRVRGSERDRLPLGPRHKVHSKCHQPTAEKPYPYGQHVRYVDGKQRRQSVVLYNLVRCLTRTEATVQDLRGDRRSINQRIILGNR